MTSTYSFDGSIQEGPTGKFSVARSAAGPVLPTVSTSAADFGTSTWDGTNYPSLHAELAITLSTDNQSCAGTPDGWSVQIATDGLSGSGGGTIPPAAMSFDGATSEAPGVTAVPQAFALESEDRTVAIGDSTYSGTHTLIAQLGLTPPSDAPIGAYSGTITITVVNGE